MKAHTRRGREAQDTVKTRVPVHEYKRWPVFRPAIMQTWAVDLKWSTGGTDHIFLNSIDWIGRMTPEDHVTVRRYDYSTDAQKKISIYLNIYFIVANITGFINY